jgi:hypothetical protein
MRNINKLKPFTLKEIQVCPVCGKVDVYLNDGHNCKTEKERQENLEYYD